MRILSKDYLKKRLTKSIKKRLKILKNSIQNLKKISQKDYVTKENQSFWNGLHALIVTAQQKEAREKMAMAEEQLLNLEGFIKGWIETAVESSERFEFFVGLIHNMLPETYRFASTNSDALTFERICREMILHLGKYSLVANAEKNHYDTE